MPTVLFRNASPAPVAVISAGGGPELGPDARTVIAGGAGLSAATYRLSGGLLVAPLASDPPFARATGAAPGSSPQRRLFGDCDESQTLRVARDYLRLERDRLSCKYNFDFATGAPRAGAASDRFAYQATPTPSPKRKRTPKRASKRASVGAYADFDEDKENSNVSSSLSLQEVGLEADNKAASYDLYSTPRKRVYSCQASANMSPLSVMRGVKSPADSPPAANKTSGVTRVKANGMRLISTPAEVAVREASAVIVSAITAESMLPFSGDVVSPSRATASSSPSPATRSLEVKYQTPKSPLSFTELSESSQTIAPLAPVTRTTTPFLWTKSRSLAVPAEATPFLSSTNGTRSAASAAGPGVPLPRLLSPGS